MSNEDGIRTVTGIAEIASKEVSNNDDITTIRITEVGVSRMIVVHDGKNAVAGRITNQSAMAPEMLR